ncbi:hypothetical protein GA0074695_2806 [Micromonospora viridifaciens]|uniref:Uncharacterized protein n=2 Tax=Micromonospora viridifaciens TaxID=1881 RepID=A0A1C4WW20_MICVI|nr:hypothetical protein GA0074695_2806 [Micromonospora viridifaciens]
MLDGLVRSLLHDVDAPSVDVLLTAVDEVMNSNTLLLKARADEAITSGNRLSVLEAFVHGPLFPDMMRAADRARHWDNLQSGPLVPRATTLKLTELGMAGFRVRLSWMLRTAFSPYRRHLGAAHADKVIDEFLNWLDHDRPGADGEGWSCWSVRPDFMYLTGYYSDQPPQSDAAYFDAGPNDTATYLHRGDILMLLLTNGSP